MPASATVPELVDVDITSLAAGGDGVGRVNGLAVFVPRTAPGDRVRVVLQSHARFARGIVEQMLSASPARVSAPCPHYTNDACGGCQWQHLSVATQREAKAQLVVDAFARIAHRSVPRPPVRGDDRVFGYRRSISFTVRGRGRRRTAGYRRAGSPDELVGIDRCLLAHGELQESWERLRHRLGELPSPVGLRGRPELRFTLRRVRTGAVAVIVEGGGAWPAEQVEAFASSVPHLQAIWWRRANGTPACVWQAEGTPAAGTPHTGQVAGDANAGAPDPVSASFVQVNAGVSALLEEHVLALVSQARNEAALATSSAPAPFRVVDAYAGRGDMAVELSRAGCSVAAIERDRQAAAYGSSRLRSPSRMLAGSVEARLAEALPADLVIVNPPRGGLDALVAAGLNAARSEPDAPRWLVYVSCDPATLARDVARLERWRVAALDCFDMFPQTAHVETVCLLRPEGQ